jgi:hypothetical protein
MIEHLPISINWAREGCGMAQAPVVLHVVHPRADLLPRRFCTPLPPLSRYSVACDAAMPALNLKLMFTAAYFSALLLQAA